MSLSQSLRPKGLPVYKFPVKKVRQIKTPAPFASQKELYPTLKEDLGGLGSTNEMRLYIALQMAGYKDIETQVPVRGGRMIKGGQVLDFVLWTPHPIPIALDGTYWHRDSAESFIDSAEIAEEYGRPPVVFYDYDTDTIPHAYAAVLRLLGRA